ncbi:MAG: PAS domain S-box protein [Thermodesulfobacteriota bacterium]
MAKQMFQRPREPIDQGQARERKHRLELGLFNEIATITAHTLDLQEIVNLVLDSVMDFFQSEGGLLLLWDPGRRRLSSAAARGFPEDYLKKISAGQLENIIGPYLSVATQPLIIQDIYSDARLATSSFSEIIRDNQKFKTVLSIPLKYREQIIGFLNLAATDPEAFPPAGQYFYAILGNQIGLAIANARLYDDLRRSEGRYRRIFEGSKDMIFVTDADGRLLDLNPAGVELLRFSSKTEALALPYFREVFQDPYDWEHFQMEAEVRGYVRDLELTLKQPGGGQVPVLLTGIVRRTREGRVTGYEGIVKDITERKLSELEILREKKTTEEILEGLPVPTFVIDQHQKIIYWNRACEELTGYSRQEMVGTYSYWLPFYSHERPSMASLVVEQHVAVWDKFSGDKNLKRSSTLPGAFEAYEYFPNFRGRERYFYHTASPIADESGQILGAVQAIVDVTEREQLARELKDSEEKFRRLVENSLDGIVLHKDLQLLYTNRASLEMFGYQNPGEMLGRDLLEFIKFPYSHGAPRRLARLLKGDTRPRIFEMKGVKQDGSQFDIEVVSFPTAYEGQPASQTHIRNITHKKHLEEHLARTEKMAALGKLAAGVAHEINNPLGSILVNSYLLLEDLEREKPEWLQVEKIVREATRCKTIVQDLLEFSRYMPAKMAPLDINTLLEEALSLVGDHLLFQYIQVDKNLQPDLPLIRGDRSKLEQVFINLLMNSGEAMEGDGRLTITTSLSAEGDQVRLSFTDTGPGINAKDLSRIFDPFFSTKEVGRGAGLGLSISYGIIQKHLGRIFVKETGPAGTTFVIELPVQRESQGN